MTRQLLAAALLLWSGAAVAADDGPVIIGPGGSKVPLTIGLIDGLPLYRVSVSFETESGARKMVSEGPLLWDVLVRAKAIDAGRARDTVHQTVIVVGADNDVASLAVGEISPEFEGKEVVLAEIVDGSALDLGHLRLAVPLDKHGGRSVRDVVRIEVTSAR